MKFKFQTFFVSLFLLGHVAAWGQPQPDFRQIRWGNSRQQVREAESPTKPSSIKKEKLVYTGIPLADRKVGLEYDFNGDSLLSATYYYYSTVSITEAEVRAAFSDFEKLLTEKYGKGKVSSSGNTRQVSWLTPRTQITLALGDVDKGWSVEVMYLCRVCAGEAGKSSSANQAWKPRKDIKDF